MNIPLEQTLMTWQTMETSLQDTFMSHIDRQRVASAFATGRRIAEALSETLVEVQQHPHADPRIDAQLIEAAQAKLRDAAANMNGAVEALKQEVAAVSELPATATKGVDPEDAKLVRARLEKLDPIEIAGEYASAVASNDLTTIHAVNTANRAAFPQIHRAMTANPDLKHEATIQVRSAGDPNQRKALEDKRVIVDAVTAIAADVQRLVGAPDPIMAMAQGN